MVVECFFLGGGGVGGVWDVIQNQTSPPDFRFQEDGIYAFKV